MFIIQICVSLNIRKIYFLAAPIFILIVKLLYYSLVEYYQIIFIYQCLGPYRHLWALEPLGGETGPKNYFQFLKNIWGGGIFNFVLGAILKASGTLPGHKIQQSLYIQKNHFGSVVGNILSYIRYRQTNTQRYIVCHFIFHFLTSSDRISVEQLHYIEDVILGVYFDFVLNRQTNSGCFNTSVIYHILIQC